MKNYLLYIILFSLTNIWHASASNKLSVTNTVIPQGCEAMLSIECLFETEFTAYQLELELPEGLYLVAGENGKAWCKNGFDNTDHSIVPTTISEGKYRFVCTSFTKSPLPMSGKLLYVKVRGSSDLSINDNFEGKVTNIEFTSLSGMVPTTLDDVNFMLTIGEPQDSRVVLDETSTTALNATTDVDVRVIRTIKANQWSTICLPFAMTEAQVKTTFGDDVELGDFTGWKATSYNDDDDPTSITVSFTNVSAIEANHPYIIKVSSAITEFNVDGVSICPEDNPIKELGKVSKKTYGSFTGSYVPTTIDEECLFLNENKFWYSTGKTKMKGFRAYFYFQGVLASYNEEASTRIAMSFDNSGITGIQDLNSVTEEHFYDLQGRRVEKPIKGMYVTKGKKAIIK